MVVITIVIILIVIVIGFRAWASGFNAYGLGFLGLNGQYRVKEKICLQ